MTNLAQELRILDVTGDIKFTWDKDKEEEVEQARRAFNDMKKKGYLAYKVKRDGSKGEVIREFDAEAEMIIMSKPLQGG